VLCCWCYSEEEYVPGSYMYGGRALACLGGRVLLLYCWLCNIILLDSAVSVDICTVLWFIQLHVYQREWSHVPLTSHISALFLGPTLSSVVGLFSKQYICFIINLLFSSLQNFELHWYLWRYMRLNKVTMWKFCQTFGGKVCARDF